MRKKDKSVVLILTFTIILVGLLILSRVYGLTNLLTLSFLKKIITFEGYFSPLIFILVYIISTILFVPMIYLTISSGIFFGPLAGAVYSNIALILSALISFYFARIFAQPFIEKFISEKHPDLYRLNSKIEEKGLIAVLLLRALPISFNLVNLFFGITKVKTSHFLISTAVWIIPETFFLSFLGGSLVELSIIKVVIILLVLITFYFTQKNLKKNF